MVAVLSVDGERNTTLTVMDHKVLASKISGVRKKNSKGCAAASMISA